MVEFNERFAMAIEAKRAMEHIDAFLKYDVKKHLDGVDLTIIKAARNTLALFVLD